MELLIENGFNEIVDTVFILKNSAMQIERPRYLKAEPYKRTERAFKMALAEMSMQGVSTRKIAKITEQLYNFE